MYVLVKKNKIRETGAESESSKGYKELNAALIDYYKYLNANAADETVERFDIVILDDTLHAVKFDHLPPEMPVL